MSDVLGTITKLQAVALLNCASTEDTRPLLNYIRIKGGIAEATNGHILVRVPIVEGGDEPVEHPERFLHRDTLKAVRLAKDKLALNLTTGKAALISSAGSMEDRKSVV